MNYLILGNSAASLFAAESLRQHDPESQITILTADAFPFYSRCLTTYFLAGDISEEQIFLRSPEVLEKLRLTIHYNSTVTRLNAAQQTVFTANGEQFSYDKLLIATGASPVILQVPGATLPEVFTLRHLEDAKRIKTHLAPGRRAVIIGGGLVSLKSAYALAKQGLQVTVIVSSGQILSQMLNQKPAGLLQEHLSQHGITFLLHEDVTEILGSHHVRAVRLKSGEELPADLIIVGKGVRPNVKPFLDSGLAIQQGILVNERLETNLPHIYAAGDVAETWDRVYNQYRINAIWPNATTQGRIAGANMAGLNEIYPGSMGMNAVDFFGLKVISAGIIRPPKSASKVDTYEEILKEALKEHPHEPSHYWHTEEFLHRKSSGVPIYQLLVWQGNQLRGFVLLGNTDKAGVLTALIHSKEELPEMLRSALTRGSRSKFWPALLSSSLKPPSTKQIS